MASEVPAATTGKTVRTLSPLRRFAGLFGLLVVMVACGAFGLWLRLRRGGPPPSAVASVPLVAHVFFAALGAFMLVGGALLYGLLLATRGFTFDFTRPVYRSFRVRMWVAHLAVELAVSLGFAAMMAGPLVLALSQFLPPAVVGIVSFFLPIVVMQYVLLWLNEWAPLEVSLIRRRLAALGVAPEVQAQGAFVGISNPDRSSWRKYGMIEDDLGMLWVHPAMLIYRGDAGGWDLPREQVVAVEREVDGGATSSYFGAAFVILRVRDASGRESRIRLHTEGDWTLTGRAKRLDELAERLESWKGEAPPAPPVTTVPPSPPSSPAAPAVTSP